MTHEHLRFFSRNQIKQREKTVSIWDPSILMGCRCMMILLWWLLCDGIIHDPLHAVDGSPLYDYFEILSVHDLLQAPRNSGRDKAAGIMIVWWSRPPLILQIHSLHQVATDTPSHVNPRRRGIIVFSVWSFNSCTHDRDALVVPTSHVRVEFLLKTESGYLRDTGVAWFTLANP